MNTDLASKIILKPHITEKTFELVERENKLCFIVSLDSTKSDIKVAINTLYGETIIKVNTARTISGKKAFVQFESVENARNLASKIGML